MEILQPMQIKIPSPYSPTSDELFEWEIFLRDAFAKVNNMKIVGKTMIVNGNQFNTVEDAIAFAHANDGVVYLPKGNYTWNGGTYTKDVFVFSDAKANVTLTAPITMAEGTSLYLENINITNNQSGAVVRVSNRTNRSGSAILKDVSITLPYIQTTYPIIFSYYDVVVLDGVDLTAQQKFSLRLGQIDNTNRLYIRNSKFVSPEMKNPYGLYIFADLSFIEKTSFYNCANYVNPQNSTSQTTAYFIDCYFEMNYSNTSTIGVALYLNIGYGNAVSGFLLRCRFVNTSTEKANLGCGIEADSTKSLIVNGCIFENLTGVRATANHHSNAYIPSCVVVNSIFKNCFRRAIEILFGGHVYLTSNLIYTDETWDGLSNYSLYGLGEAIRLYVYRVPADNTITNSWDNPVYWVVQNNVIRRYLKAGIRVMVDSSSTPSRRVYTKIVLKDNFIGGVNYNILLNTSKSSYESTYGVDSWERGSGFVAYNGSAVDVTWVALEIDGMENVDCYIGFAWQNYRFWITGTDPEGLYIRRLKVGRTVSTQGTYIRWAIYVAFSSSAYFENPIFFVDYEGYEKFYINNGVKSVIFVGGFLSVQANPFGSPDIFSDVNSNVRLAFVGTHALLSGSTGGHFWMHTFEKYEGNISALPLQADSSRKYGGGFVGGDAVGRYAISSALDLYRADGSAPAIVTVNSIPYKAFQITASQPVYAQTTKPREPLQSSSTRQLHGLSVGIVLSGVPNGENVTIDVSASSIYGNNFQSLASYTVAGNGGVATYTKYSVIIDNKIPQSAILRFSISSNPSAGSVYITHAELAYSERTYTE